ncbi:MAG: hypothetical protein JWP49_1290 [Phenylobacterium sp.]|nr:hypothetical protein [Phenylobacterium sp.]
MTREAWLRPPDDEATLPRLLGEAVARHGPRPLLTCGARTLTFADADSDSRALAKALVARGVGKGTRVGLLMPNTTEWLTCYLAVTRVGAIAVLLSTLYQRKDLAWVLRHADVHTLLLAHRFLNHDYVARLEEIAPDLAGQDAAAGPLLTPALPYLRQVIVWGEGPLPAWALTPQACLDAATQDPRLDDAMLRQIEATIAPADLAVLMYTSGSTADPKGILHTHGAIVRRMQILSHIRQSSAEDRSLVVGPFCWAAGFITLNMSLLMGGSMLCPVSPKIDDIVTAMAEGQPTDLSAQPGMIKQLREHPRIAAGEAGAEVLALLDSRLTGARSDQASRGLGMTETFGQHSAEPRKDEVPAAKIEAFGRGVPDIERRIRNPATGAWLGVDEEGVLWVRGPNITPALYKKERHEVFDADGFYDTGDLCRIDAEGWLFFSGRNSEMIKVSGANVAPREVELAIEAYPEVQEASVFELIRDGHAPIVAAVVVPKPEASIDIEALRAGLRGEIASFKIPKLIVAMSHEDAPRTGSGKLHKPRLREMLAAG